MAWPLALACLLGPGGLFAQDETDAETNAEVSAHAPATQACVQRVARDSTDKKARGVDTTGCSAGQSLSNYSEKLTDPGDSKSVESELIRDDTVKPAIFPIDVWHTRLDHFYDYKQRVSDRLGLAWSVDYTVLFQTANFTESGEDTASSSVFRILGTWLHVGDRGKTWGNLVWKMETRNPIFGNPTPRDMGFDTGSALSTANFKVLDYWGITDLYWKQRFRGGYTGFIIGTWTRVTGPTSITCPTRGRCS